MKKLESDETNQYITVYSDNVKHEKYENGKIRYWFFSIEIKPHNCFLQTIVNSMKNSLLFVFSK